jgi:hypothetical protein
MTRMLDRSSSFETAAARPPQNEDCFYTLMVRSAAQPRVSNHATSSVSKA